MKFRILAVSFVLSWLGSMFPLHFLKQRRAEQPAPARVKSIETAEKMPSAIEESEDYQAAPEDDEGEAIDPEQSPIEESRPARVEWSNYWFPFRTESTTERRE